MSAHMMRFDNRLNLLKLHGFTNLEINILFCALFKLQERGPDQVVISYEELCKLANFSKTNAQYVFEKLQDAKTKIFNLSLTPLAVETPEGTCCGTYLFSLWENNRATKTLKCRLNENLLWLVNNKKTGYTSFKLQEFVSLNSIYAKHLFQTLKQWRTLGKFQFHHVDSLRDILEIPKNMDDRYLLTRIIRPAIKEIREKTESFRNLSCNSIRKGRNHKLTGVIFCWTPERKGLHK